MKVRTGLTHPQEGWLDYAKNPGQPSPIQAPSEAGYGHGVREAEPGYSARYPQQYPEASWAKMAAMKYLVVLEQSSNGFGAYVPDLPGCVAAAETRAEVVSLIREAIEFHIEGLRQAGDPVPPPTSQGEIVDVRAA